MSVTGIYLGASPAGSSSTGGPIYDPLTNQPLYHEYYAVTYDNAPTQFLDFGPNSAYALVATNYNHDDFSTSPYVVSIGNTGSQIYGSMDAAAAQLQAYAQNIAANLSNGQTAYGGTIQNSNSAAALLGIAFEGGAVDMGALFGIEVPGQNEPLDSSYLTPVATPDPQPGPPPDPSTSTPYSSTAYQDPNTVTGSSNSTTFEIISGIYGGGSTDVQVGPGA